MKLSQGAKNLLAQIASYGSVSSRDIAQMNQYAKASRTTLKKWAAFYRRGAELVAAELVCEKWHDFYILDAGEAALAEMGYEKISSGAWVKSGVRRPEWAT